MTPETAILALSHPVAIIANRDFKLPDDGFLQLFPFAEVPGPIENPDGTSVRVVQILDAPAADALLTAFRAEAAQPNFGGKLVDFEHFSLDPSKESRAAMWIEEMQKRADGVYVRPRITNSGEAALKGGDYRFLSPVLEFASRTYRTGERVRPIGLHSAGLTNDPRAKGGRPISNRNGPAAAGNNQPEPTMKNVNKELGLAEDAPEASTVAEVQTIKNRATTLQSQVTALTKERDTLLTAQIERDLDDHKDVIADREAVKAQLVANRAGTLVVLGGLKKPAKKDPPARITNRDGATPPEADPAASAEETAADKSRAAKIANRASELRKTTPSLTRSQAFQKAQDELTA